MQQQSKPVLDHREFPVLYVDDEPENLRVFELAFRRQFSILTAQSAEEGLRLLNENPVAVVLSDQRMPEVSGVEFLSRVRSLDPTTIRILVTAYGDAEILGEAINDGDWMTQSCMMGLMGREAGYSGKTITWEQMMNSEKDITPASLDFGPAPEIVIPRPGFYEFS